jgi:hypothetical protein
MRSSDSQVSIYIPPLVCFPVPCYISALLPALRHTSCPLPWPLSSCTGKTCHFSHLAQVCTSCFGTCSRRASSSQLCAKVRSGMSSPVSPMARAIRLSFHRSIVSSIGGSPLALDQLPRHLPTPLYQVVHMPDLVVSAWYCRCCCLCPDGRRFRPVACHPLVLPVIIHYVPHVTLTSILSFSRDSSRCNSILASILSNPSSLWYHWSHWTSIVGGSMILLFPCYRLQSLIWPGPTICLLQPMSAPALPYSRCYPLVFAIACSRPQVGPSLSNSVLLPEIL